MMTVLEAERRVAKCHALIERQRHAIEALQEEGVDTISAEIVFESLCLSLSMLVKERHGLRVVHNSKAA